MPKVKIIVFLFAVCSLLVVGCNDMGVDMELDAMMFQGIHQTPDKVHVGNPYSFVLPIVNNRTEEPVQAQRIKGGVVKNETKPYDLNNNVTVKPIHDSTAVKISGIAKAPGQVSVSLYAYRDDMVSADWTWEAKVIK